jgi:hypothetical protein
VCENLIPISTSSAAGTRVRIILTEMMAAATAGPLAVSSAFAKATVSEVGACPAFCNQRVFSVGPLYQGLSRHSLVCPKLPLKQALGRTRKGGVARAGLESFDVPGALSTAQSVLSRAHDLVYTLAADSAVADATQAASDAVQKNDNSGPLNFLTGIMESTLNVCCLFACA